MADNDKVNERKLIEKLRDLTQGDVIRWESRTAMSYSTEFKGVDFELDTVHRTLLVNGVVQIDDSGDLLDELIRAVEKQANPWQGGPGLSTLSPQDELKAVLDKLDS